MKKAKGRVSLPNSNIMAFSNMLVALAIGRLQWRCRASQREADSGELGAEYQGAISSDMHARPTLLGLVNTYPERAGHRDAGGVEGQPLAAS